MDAKILYFYIFGIITVTTGNPASYNTEDTQYIRNTHELENLLKSLADQGKIEIASNYHGDAPNVYHQNRAGSSRYDVNPSPLYYKVDAPQYYESGENANDEQPTINDLQMINQFLKQNDGTQGSNNAQNLIEDLLSLDRNNKIQTLKPNDDTNNVNEVVALLGELQRISDDGNYRDYKDYDNLRGNLFYEENDKPIVARQVKSDRGQTKNGVRKLVENIIGNKPQYRDVKYLNVDDNELSRNDRDGLRCTGKSCARTNVVNDDKITRLRCQGRYCTRTTDNDKLNYDSKLPAQKIKLSDELDAVVLGLSDADHFLTKLIEPNPTRTNQLRGTQLLENVKIDNLLNSKSSIGNEDNVEAIVFDLTKVKNGDAVARQIKQLLTRNDEGSYDEYEDYGNLVQSNLKQGVYDLQKPVGTGRANLKKNKNNIYLPQWLLDGVISKSNGKYPERDHISRSLIPLTRQQKERMNRKRNQNAQRVYRRSLDQDVGVPFHMEVQGLGQVIP